MKSVSGVADAIANEFNAGEYKIGAIVPTAEVNGALTSFSDKIADSFSSMLDRLQAIAERVTFTTPVVASGVVPYQAAAVASAGGSGSVSDTITASNDELASVIIQAVTGATAAVVNAIQEYSGTTVNLDASSLTDRVVSEINRIFAVREASKIALFAVCKHSFIFVLVAAATALVANAVQIGFVFSFEPLKPDLKKVNPAEGAKKIFSMKNLFEFFKNVVKVTFLGYLIYKIVASSVPALLPMCYGSMLCQKESSLLTTMSITVVRPVAILASTKNGNQGGERK